MKKAATILVVILMAVPFVLVMGCGGGTELTVKAPSGVEVESASVGSDGMLKCNLTSNKSGELKFSLPYEKTVTPKSTENIEVIGGSGKFVTTGTASFTEDVEANENQDISKQSDMLKGDVSFGTLVIEWEAGGQSQP